MSSAAIAIERRNMIIGSAPPSIIRAIQYNAPCGSLPRRLLWKALNMLNASSPRLSYLATRCWSASLALSNVITPSSGVWSAAASRTVRARRPSPSACVAIVSSASSSIVRCLAPSPRSASAKAR